MLRATGMVRYVGSFRGVKILRGSQMIDAHLERRAEQVAEAARSHYAALGEDFPVEVVQERSDTRAPRARVAVIARSAAALRIERAHRVLGAALDAARG